MLRVLSTFCVWVLVLPNAFAQGLHEPAKDSVPSQRYRLVEPFTAYTLEQGEVKLGLINVDVGVLENWSIGTDFLADIVGAPNIKTKYRALRWEDNVFSLGLRAAYLSRETILWGTVKKYFDRLEARIVSPSLSWTNEMSPRLRLHTHWGVGFGQVEAELSEEGKRRLWETKHPNSDYDSRDEDDSDADNDETSEGENQEKAKSSDQPASFKQRTLMFSSVTGMLSDIFQITGEFQREGGNKILISSRVERTQIEDLKASSFRLTAAQQWIWEHFQLRLGVGLQYLVITGTDLDGEEIDEAGVLPASDIDLYWRF